MLANIADHDLLITSVTYILMHKFIEGLGLKGHTYKIGVHLIVLSLLIDQFYVGVSNKGCFLWILCKQTLQTMICLLHLSQTLQTMMRYIEPDKEILFAQNFNYFLTH